MKFPAWTPPRLIEAYKELKPKADADRKRRNEAKEDGTAVDWRTFVRTHDHWYQGITFLGDEARLRVLEVLILNPRMKDVWKSLRRRDRFKPRITFFGVAEMGNRTAELNLVAACVEAETDWIKHPKWTKAEYRKRHEHIAAVAGQLCDLLFEVHDSRYLVDTRKYITEAQYEGLFAALEADGHEIWDGFDGFFNEELQAFLPTVPRILLELRERALERAKHPQAVSQPKSPTAKQNFFIEEISEYFVKSYGQPLHAHVAAVVSALFEKDVDENRVRALLRSRRSGSGTTRRSTRTGKQNIYG